MHGIQKKPCPYADADHYKTEEAAWDKYEEQLEKKYGSARTGMSKKKQVRKRSTSTPTTADKTAPSATGAVTPSAPSSAVAPDASPDSYAGPVLPYSLDGGDAFFCIPIDKSLPMKQSEYINIFDDDAMFRGFIVESGRSETVMGTRPYASTTLSTGTLMTDDAAFDEVQELANAYDGGIGFVSIGRYDPHSDRQAPDEVAEISGDTAQLVRLRSEIEKAVTNSYAGNSAMGLRTYITEGTHRSRLAIPAICNEQSSEYDPGKAWIFQQVIRPLITSMPGWSVRKARITIIRGNR